MNANLKFLVEVSGLSIRKIKQIQLTLHLTIIITLVERSSGRIVKTLKEDGSVPIVTSSSDSISSNGTEQKKRKSDSEYEPDTSIRRSTSSLKKLKTDDAAVAPAPATKSRKSSKSAKSEDAKTRKLDVSKDLKSPLPKPAKKSIQDTTSSSSSMNQLKSKPSPTTSQPLNSRVQSVPTPVGQSTPSQLNTVFHVPPTQKAPTSEKDSVSSNSGPRPSVKPSTGSQGSNPTAPTAQPTQVPTSNVKPSVQSVILPQAGSLPVYPLSIHHPRHHYLDGSIIVIISHTEFKLYRGALVRAGGWFRARFGEVSSLANSNAQEKGNFDANANTTNDRSVPICALDGVVSEEDFVALLDAMEDAINFSTSAPPSFAKVASILRASHALDFAKFYNWSKRVLEKMWGVADDSSSVTSLRPLQNLVADHATETIIIARTCGVPRVLRRAMYELLRSEEFGRPLSKSGSVGEKEREASGRGKEISNMDYQRLIKARETLSSLWMGLLAPGGQGGNSIITCPQNYPGNLVKTGSTSTSTPLSVQQCPSTHSPRDIENYLRIFKTYGRDPLIGLEELCDVQWSGPFGFDASKIHSGESPSSSECKHCHAASAKWKCLRQEWWGTFGSIVEC
ncbi:hypothetical protein F5051DRAFT_252980 [Lentinula edodes]|nr:hypothetical protein F5051DRAFT_252980 [Lentinula edodes]